MSMVNHWSADDVRRSLGPHVESLVKEWGLKLTGHRTAKGWAECHAFGRDDDTPSAAINVNTGAYKDQGGSGESLSIFALAVEMKIYSGYSAAVNAIGERIGIPPKSAHRPGNSKDASDRSDASDASAKSRGKQASAPQEGQSDTSDASPGPFVAKGHATFDAACRAAERTAKLRKVKAKYLKHWTYFNIDWTEALRSVRFRAENAKGKDYRPIHERPGAGWYVGDPPHLADSLPLYNLPALAESGSARVVVVEGEGLADLLAGLGILATTSAHGAKSAKKSDWSPLAGRKVVIIPDVDADKSGDAYAAEVAAILGGLTPKPSVRLLRLPGLSDGEDLAQWVERLPDTWDDVRTREELERLIDGAVDPAEPELPHDDELGLVCLDGVEVKPVEWLWQDRIPRGKITLLAGEGEIGKTFLALDIITRLTRGRPFPDRPNDPIQPCDCVFVTAEDGIADTIKPRLLAMGADCKRAFTIVTGKLPNGKASPFTIADIDKLETIMAKRPAIRLIVIDPIAAFLGRVDENKNAELRGLLGPLSDFADRYNVAIGAITHFGKNPSAKVTSRILGSVAYSNAARATWCVVADPEDEDRRLMLRVKNNLSADKSGMAYRIEGGVVVWEPDPIHVRASDVLASANGDPNRNEAKRDKLAAFLRDLLAAGPVPSDEVKAKARAAGFGKDAVWKAKDELGIRAKKHGMTGGWVWEWTGPTGEASEASEPSESSEPSEASSKTYSVFSNKAKPHPPGFIPEGCHQCKSPIKVGGYFSAWDGDTPIGVCWTCNEKFGA